LDLKVVEGSQQAVFVEYGNLCWNASRQGQNLHSSRQKRQFIQRTGRALMHQIKALPPA
jgi:hypothetical protein